MFQGLFNSAESSAEIKKAESPARKLTYAPPPSWAYCVRVPLTELGGFARLHGFIFNLLFPAKRVPSESPPTRRPGNCTTPPSVEIMQTQTPDDAPRSRLSRSPPTNSEPESKRRKTRKGTSSCWECKRRKTRCIFANPEDAVCVACRRRGMACVSQEYDEVPSRRTGKAPEMGDRIVRVETLVAELVKKVSGVPGTTATTPEGRVGRQPGPPSEPEFSLNILTPDDSASESAHHIGVCDDTPGVRGLLKPPPPLRKKRILVDL